MSTSVQLADATKVAALTAYRVLLDGGKLRLRDSTTATIVDITLSNPAGTFTSTTLNLTVPVTGVSVIGAVAVDAMLLTSADATVAGPIPVYVDGSAEHIAAEAAGDIYIAADTTTIIAGQDVTLTSLPNVMLDPVP